MMSEFENKKVMAETYLFDGSDEELYTNVFTLPLSNGDQLVATADSLALQRLDNVSAYIDKNLLDLIVVTCKLKKSPLSGDYINLDGLTVYEVIQTSVITSKKYLV